MSAQNARFRAVYDDYFDFVWRFAVMRGVGPEALDGVVQKVFSVMHGRLVALEDEATLRSSIAGITRNTVRAHLRRSAVSSPMDGARREPAPAAEDDSSLAEKTPAELLELIFTQMTEPEREVFLLFEVEGFSLDETAYALRVSERTLAERLDGARKVYNIESARLRAERFWSSRPEPPEPEPEP